MLAALSTAADVTTFSAATSLFGVSDLNKLAEFTHKFESQYMYHLLGGTPEEVPGVYHARSPINHTDKIVVPLLVISLVSIPVNLLITADGADLTRRKRQSRAEGPGRGYLQKHSESRRRGRVQVIHRRRSWMASSSHHT